MLRASQLLYVTLLVATSATAQDMSVESTTLPPPPAAMDRITAPENNDAAIMTTRDQPASEAAPGTPAFTLPAPGTQAMPASPPPANYQPKIPFGRAEPTGPAIPSGPRATISVPVVSVDEVEAAEPSPPEPPSPGEDPAQEDPAEPTDLTSPIFEPEISPGKAPRQIIIRALNKVTAQAALLTLKPGETVKFGQIDITAPTCRTSSPTSQTDYAGFLDIVERLPKQGELKPLFRGWMYASSPSITALEHPVYDVTMVECKMVQPKPEPEEKKR